jgi:hypothetical protein
MKPVITTIWALLIGALLFTGCETQQPEKSEVTSGDTKADCFEQLHPGKIKDGEMNVITFQHGACLGKYKALNKVSSQNTVTLLNEKGSTNIQSGTKSKIYVDGSGKTSVKVNNDFVKIGQKIGSNQDVALLMDVDFGLVVSNNDGSLKLWELSDGQGARRVEEIVLYLP